MAEIKENNDMSKAKIGSNKTQENATVKAQAKSGTKVTKNTFFQKALRQILAAILFLVIGAGLIYFLVYQPASKDLATQKEEAARLQNIESQYNALQTDYNTLNTKHEVAVTLVNIYQIQNNINIARIALMDGNDTRLSIALGYVEKDIETLDIGEFPEKIDLTSRVNTVKGYLPDQPQNALQELESLFDDLLLLANNLEITD
ncbi:MAG: hypothetical protein GYA52_02525 [Chloroflexi bacterium]|jgi:hypothetical protein|nr:hypothetical protein [Chloroflexota bacterium]